MSAAWGFLTGQLQSLSSNWNVQHAYRTQVFLVVLKSSSPQDGPRNVLDSITVQERKIMGGGPSSRLKCRHSDGGSMQYPVFWAMDFSAWNSSLKADLYQGPWVPVSIPPQRFELDVYGRRGYESKKLIQVHYLCIFFIFYASGINVVNGEWRRGRIRKRGRGRIRRRKKESKRKK